MVVKPKPDTVVTLGIDVGKLRDPAAVCIAEAFPGDFHVVHRLERFPLDTPYTELARLLGESYGRTVHRLVKQQAADEFNAGGTIYGDEHYRQDGRARGRIWVMADATGVGLPVVDDLRERAGIEANHLCGVMITAGYGSDLHRGARSGSVSKSFLISRLRAVIGSDRLALPDTDEARALLDELRDFQQDLSDSGTPTFNAAPGRHDDLISAVALSVVLGSPPLPGSCRYA